MTRCFNKSAIFAYVQRLQMDWFKNIQNVLMKYMDDPWGSILVLQNLIDLFFHVMYVFHGSPIWNALGNLNATLGQSLLWLAGNCLWTFFSSVLNSLWDWWPFQTYHLNNRIIFDFLLSLIQVKWNKRVDT